MNKFNKIFDLIMEDIIQSVTPEELKDRQSKYIKILLKKYFDQLIMKKNKDGSYDVDSTIDLYNEQLTSLEDIPYKLNTVNGNFHCAFNKLTNLKGCPKIITGHFHCERNKLTSLEGCPKEVKGNFWIQNMTNGFKFKEEDIRKVCKVGGSAHV